MKNQSRRHAAPASERGQSLTELALLLPMLLLLVLGTLDLARIYEVYVSIQNAAREGARYASAKPTDSAGVTAAVNRELTNTGISLTGAPTVSCQVYPDGTSEACDADGIKDSDYVTVQISTRYRFISLFIVDEAHSTMTLSTNATMALKLSD